MAKPKKDPKWIQKATSEIKGHKTVGKFTTKAKRHKMTPVEYAKVVLAHPEKHHKVTVREAQFVKNVNPELFNPSTSSGINPKKRNPQLRKLSKSDYSRKVNEVADRVFKLKKENPRARLSYATYQPSGVVDLFGTPEAKDTRGEGRRQFLNDVDDKIIELKKKDKSMPKKKDPITLKKVLDITVFIDKNYEGWSDEDLSDESTFKEVASKNKINKEIASDILYKYTQEGKVPAIIYQEIEREHPLSTQSKKSSSKETRRHSDKYYIIRALKDLRDEYRGSDEGVKANQVEKLRIKIKGGQHVALNDKGACIVQEKSKYKYKYAGARNILELSKTDKKRALKKAKSFLALYKSAKRQGDTIAGGEPVDTVIEEYSILVNEIRTK